MASADVASAVGTWIAAFIAIIALFGILGPWLVWCTLRSERHIATNAVDDPRHQFISAGIKIWNYSRLFRRVRVPNLIEPPDLTEQHEFPRNDDQLLKPSSKTGWFMFAQGLRAFSINFEKNGDLVIHNRESWLPVHKLWFLAFGLLTRSEHRFDKGQAIQLSNGARLDHQFDRKDQKDLFGSLDVLHHGLPSSFGDFDKVFLTPYNSQLRGNLRPAAMSLSTLFWLSVGCLPLDGSRVFDLAGIRERYHSEEQGGRLINMHPKSTKHSGHSSTILRFEPLTDVITSSQYSVWAQTMGCDMRTVQTLEHVPVNALTQADREDLWATIRADDQYKDSSWSSWFLLDKLNVCRADPFPRGYMCKSDIQTLALALLLMQCSPRHFLFDKDRTQFGYRSLTLALDWGLLLAPAVTGRPCDGKFSIYRKRLEAALGTPTKEVHSLSFSRTNSTCLYELDVLLQQILPGSPAIRLTIGILSITSETFRQFLSDVVFHDLREEDCLVEVDMKTNAVRTSSPRNTLTEHRLNFQDVFPPENLPALQPTTAIPIYEVILAAVQAWARIS